MFETDALVFSKGLANPAAVGAFPKAIRMLHKELGLLGLEETVAKMTGYSAERIGIKDRGFVRPGNWEDLTIFDLAELEDNTTTTNTGARPSGIRHVFLNGRHTVQDGVADRGIRNGRVLRR